MKVLKLILAILLVALVQIITVFGGRLTRRLDHKHR